jgi:hypothetical protein
MAAVDRRAAAPPDVAALLADVAGVGPFFAVGTGPLPGEGWAPVGALGTTGGALADRIEAVGAALGVRGRPAVSIAFQGLAAQVVAPLFAAVVEHGVLPGDTVASSLYWRPAGTGPWLWWTSGGPVVACPEPAALHALLTTLLAPVVAAARGQVAVSERVLWGNVASSLASARRLLVAARPHTAPRAAVVARHLLATAPLAATATLRDPVPPDVGWTFHRRSCCLYHRVPGGGTCGDCVLRPPVG